MTILIIVISSGCISDSVDEESSVPPEVSTWLRENAIPSDTVEPGSGFDDLMPLKEIIGGAHIVALGEATHGTSEFFKMKHRNTGVFGGGDGFQSFCY